MKTLTRDGKWIAFSLLCFLWAIGVFNVIKHLRPGTALGILAAVSTVLYVMLTAYQVFGRRVL